MEWEERGRRIREVERHVRSPQLKKSKGTTENRVVRVTCAQSCHSDAVFRRGKRRNEKKKRKIAEHKSSRFFSHLTLLEKGKVKKKQGKMWLRTVMHCILCLSMGSNGLDVWLVGSKALFFFLLI